MLGILAKLTLDTAVPTVVEAIANIAPVSVLTTTTGLLAALEGPVPFALTALTVYVYVPTTVS
jgi:hypothetical protein